MTKFMQTCAKRNRKHFTNSMSDKADKRNRPLSHERYKDAHFREH